MIDLQQKIHDQTRRFTLTPSREDRLDYVVRKARQKRFPDAIPARENCCAFMEKN